MRLLVVEDDAKTAHFINQGLQDSGYEVDLAATGTDALRLGSDQKYDLVVLDLMLPGVDGLTVLKYLREKKDRLPVIILSAKRSVDERITGLKAGGDDYLVKPFSLSELLVRIETLLRRAQPPVDESQLSAEDLTVNLFTREVKRLNTKIELQAREFALLSFFMRHPGQPLSKTLILDKIWNYRFDPQTNVVDVLVCRLRNKIDKDFEPKLIHTIRGVGYVFGKR